MLNAFLVLIAGGLFTAIQYFFKSRWWGMTLFMTVTLAGVALMWWPGKNGYTLKDRLQYGPDLAGGTQLVYDVQVPAGRDAAEVVENTIKVLHERIDPKGLRNLTLRRMGEKRILVQMPAPKADVSQRREAWEGARRELLDLNLEPAALEDALAKDAAAGNHEALAKVIGAAPKDGDAWSVLAGRFADRARAKAAYQAAEGAWRKAGGLNLADDAPETKAFSAADEAYAKAKAAYDSGLALCLKQAALPAPLLERLVTIPAEPDLAEGKVGRRGAMLADLQKEYPRHAAALAKALAGWESFEKVKGDLETPEDLNRLIQGSGKLEFRIAPAWNDPDLANPAPYLKQLSERGPRSFRNDPYAFYEVDNLTQYLDLQPDKREQLKAAAKVLEVGGDDPSVDQLQRAVAETMEQTLDPDPARAEAATAKIERLLAGHGAIPAVYAGKAWLLLGNTVGRNAITAEQTWALTRSQESRDQFQGLAVAFELDARGAELMGNLTRVHRGRMMAILLDGKVLTHPNINDTITNNCQITGRFSQSDVNYMLSMLKAGSVEGRITGDPVSVKTTAPELGADNLVKGMDAGLWACIIIGGFMLAYFFVAGMTANIAVAVNLILVLGTMIAMGATFTMPGIAGMVLTVGIAVDANILIYERIREEQARGKDLHAAIHDGHHRAFWTIFDSHVTQLLVAWVLAGCAPFNLVDSPADLKGFAITLGIGIAVSLFTSLFGAYVFLDLFVHLFKPKKLHMLPTVFPGMQRAFTPDIPWVRLSRWFLPATTVLCVGCVALAVWRGSDLLDVEFRSGSQVGFRLAKTADAEDAPHKRLPREEVTRRLHDAIVVATALQRKEPVPAEVKNGAELSRRLAPVVQEALQRGEAAGHPADFSLLSAEYLTAIGQDQGGFAEFSWKTLLVDARAVQDVIQVALAGDLDIPPPVSFEGAGQPIAADAAHVLAVTSRDLSALLKRDLPPGVGSDAREFVGGACLVVEGMQPALTQRAFEDRLKRKRTQPPFDSLPPRQLRVVPLEAGPDGRSHAFAVLAADETTSYVDDPQGLLAAGGLADSERQVVQAALRDAGAFDDVAVFGAQVSGTIQRDAFIGMLIAFIGICAYVWFRFQSWRYGVAAIAATLHDICVAIGAVALTAFIAHTAVGRWLDLPADGFKINLAMVTAVLTIMGYSVNDTVVVFDRIREARGRMKMASAAHIDDAINHTLSRTTLSSGTTLMAALVLFFVGGPAVHGFAFTMVVGIVIGTWSSIVLAAPMLLIGTGGKGLSLEDKDKGDIRSRPSAPGEPVGL